MCGGIYSLFHFKRYTETFTCATRDVSQAAVRPSYGRPVLNLDGYISMDGHGRLKGIFPLKRNLQAL